VSDPTIDNSNYYTITKRITWNPVPGATSYNVYYGYRDNEYSDSPSHWMLAGSVSNPPLVFTFPRTTPGVGATYTSWRVTAINSAGESRSVEYITEPEGE
jgi:hypothetical protein